MATTNYQLFRTATKFNPIKNMAQNKAQLFTPSKLETAANYTPPQVMTGQELIQSMPKSVQNRITQIQQSPMPTPQQAQPTQQQQVQPTAQPTPQPTTQPTPQPTQQPAQPMQQPGTEWVRDFLVKQGVPDAQIGWDGKQVTVGGVPLNIQGIQNINGRTYADPNAILQAYNMAYPANTINTSASPDIGLQNAYNQYGQAVTTFQDVIGTIQDTPFNDQYFEHKQALLQQLDRPFEYNPDTDIALQQAQQTASRRVMEELNARGILNSTITADNVSQVMAQLVPEYRRIAFDEYNQQVNNIMKRFDLLQGLTELDYRQYKDWVDQNMDLANTNLNLAKENLNLMYKEIERQENEELKKAQARESEVKKAWERTNIRGYVDNADALILGLPPGTLSQDARQRVERMEDFIYQEKIRTENNMKEIAARHRNTMSEISARQKASSSVAGLKLNDYIKMGSDMLDKGYNNPIRNENGDIIGYQYTPVRSPEEVLDWALGLPLDGEEVADLLNILGIANNPSKQTTSTSKSTSTNNITYDTPIGPTQSGNPMGTKYQWDWNQNPLGR